MGSISVRKPREVVASDNGSASGGAPRGEGDTSVESRLMFRADSGSRRCEEDPELVVRYGFHGRRLVPGPVFTAILTANTFFRQHGEDERGVGMVAYGSDWRIHLDVAGVRQGPGIIELPWGLARIAMRTVWREILMRLQKKPGQFVDGPRWEALAFRLEYRSVSTGEGWLG